MSQVLNNWKGKKKEAYISFLKYQRKLERFYHFLIFNFKKILKTKYQNRRNHELIRNFILCHLKSKVNISNLQLNTSFIRANWVKIKSPINYGSFFLNWRGWDLKYLFMCLNSTFSTDQIQEFVGNVYLCIVGRDRAREKEKKKEKRRSQGNRKKYTANYQNLQNKKKKL